MFAKLINYKINGRVSIHNTLISYLMSIHKNNKKVR